MAETKDTISPAKSRVPGPELRLVDRRAYVGFPTLELAPGVVITEFALQIPDVTFPLNVSGGASKYQKKKLDFGVLELALDAEVLAREVRGLAKTLPELDDVKLHFRPGALEVQARLRQDRTPVTFKVAFDGDAEKLAVYLYDVRFYAYSTTPAARLGATLSEAIRDEGLLPDVERRGANGFTTRVLPQLVEQAAVGRGFKMPALDQARLAEATVSSTGLKLRFTAGGLPPPGTPDEELMLALEGARAFSDAEELVARGRLEEARAAYLKLGDATEAHPFAVERLLTLLVTEPQSHELALDVAQSLARRRERSATALWVEAVARERRGEFARAAERYLALSTLARRSQEEAAAFFAAEASARASRDHAPQLAVKALHELLGLQPDHLPSLKALARASDQSKDRAGAIRAYRRLAALARDPADAAEAHVQLARLCAQTEDDVAGARLHCEAALRLTPDHPEALLQLGELCYRSGEWLRAVKALDRLREVAMGRHEVDRVGRANLLAGLVWETGLKQPENALLRYREAASLLPAEARPPYLAARVAESLGKVQEAVAGYQQAIELAGPAPAQDEVRQAAHASHHALARLLKARLGEPARAREHLEAALALDPQDTVALDELLPYFRASGRAAELADACEKAAAVIEAPARRAELWAEAGELYRGRLNQPERAERLLAQALEADPRSRLALEGLLALAESKRDGAQLTRCLKALAELAESPKERVRHLRRLAVAARDLAFDLDLASFAFREVLRVEADDLPVLGELTALERRRADMAGLAWALEQRARVAEGLGDKRLAAAALRELCQVLDERLGRAGEALVALEKSTRLFPEPNTLLELANLSLRLERPTNARRALEDVLALLPRHAAPERLAEVRARLGRACELLGDTDAARENYALAFPLRRLDDDLAQRLEALYADANQTRELSELWAARAQALLQAGRSHDAAPLFLKAAQRLLEAGDASGAMLRLTAALDASPTGAKAAEVLEAMAQLEVARREPAEAARLLARRAALAEPGREAARWLFKASALCRGTPREQPLLAQALDQDGTFLPARLRRAEVMEEAAPREALADFEAVLAADPRDPDAAGLELDRTALTHRAARAALRSGHYEVARRLFARYVTLAPDDTAALQELAGLHRRAGALEALVDLLPDLWPRLDGAARAAARKEHAEGALSLGRTAAAIDALRGLLLEIPSDAWAAGRLLALLAVDDASAPERLALLTRLVDAASGEERAELLTRRAELRRLSGDLLTARADLLDAAQLSARPVPLYRAIAELARESQDEAAELSAWRFALAQSGADAALQADAAQRLLALARGRSAADDRPRALEAWEALAALPLDGAERFEAWYGLAQAARALDRLTRAEVALLEASRQGPVSRRVDALVERALLLETRGAPDEAVESFSAALALAPRHPLATQGLVRALRAEEDWEGLAEVLSTEAAQLPRAEALPVFAELAALYLDRLGLLGPGEAALRRLVALDDADAAARRRLAGLLEARGELAEAVALLEEAAARLPASDAAPVLRAAAAVALRAEDAAAELRLLRIAHVLQPGTGDELRRLADALYLHGAVREALPLQREVAEASSFEDTPELAESAWLRLADLAEQAGDAALAEVALRRVAQERPLSELAVERLAALVGQRDARAGFALRARYAESLSRSPRTAARLVELAREARQAHGDLDAAARLFSLAAEAADAPLPVREEAAAMLREAGRTAELMVELDEVAQLHVVAGAVDAALAAWDEQGRLAEGAGRIDDALRTLTAMAELCEEEGRSDDAARQHLRRAELLRDTKLDLGGAAEALERAWALAPRADVAEQGSALAQRRGDREAEIDWLERRLSRLAAPSARAAAMVQLARLHLGLAAEGPIDMPAAPLLAPDQAEAALDAALALDASTPDAEALLLGLYERQDRVADIAGYYEDAAGRASPGPERASLLLRAAELYRDRAGRPNDAAAALLAARAADPDDATLTARVADLLVELGHRQDAADFDALLLERDPFHPSFARHADFLTATADALGLAALLSRRAERLSGAEAADGWLAAARAFHRAGAPERAWLCEAQAFEASPENSEAFGAVCARAQGEPRRLAELLAVRARAVPAEAPALLRRRAEVLARAGEPLLAAEGWDDYLAVAPEDLEALEARALLAAQGGGPRASQPFDRRLVQLGGAALPAATRRLAWLRLGRAALEARAFQDAVDAFEEAFTLDADGPSGREALAALSEAYAELDDTAGQVRTTLRLAERAQGGEAEALYRQTLSLAERPVDAIAAFDWLLPRHAAEAPLYEAGQRAYRDAGRLGDLVALHERFAAAAGGPAAARALLAAAQVVEHELGEPQRAYELKQAALVAAPEDLAALQAVLEDARARRDVPVLEAQLASLARATPDAALSAELTLELAASLEARGAVDEARAVLEPIRRQGPSAAGYSQALKGLEGLARRRGDLVAVAELQLEAAELLPGAERAERMLEAAQLLRRAGLLDRALGLTREALAARPTRAGQALLVELARESGRGDALARALVDLAALVEASERAPLLLEAVDAWSAAGQRDEAVAVLERVLTDFPARLSPIDASARLLALGAAPRALAVGFGPSMQARDFRRALELADAAGDAARAREALEPLALAAPEGDDGRRFVELLRAAGDVEGLGVFAEEVRGQAPALARSLWTGLLLEAGWTDAVEGLVSLGALGDVVPAAVASGRPAVLLALLPHRASLEGGPFEALLAAVAGAVPARRAAMLRELADARRREGRLGEAAATLLELAQAEDDPRARAALHVERGELLLQAEDLAGAQVAFERALVDDAAQTAAVRALVPLYQGGPPDRFVAMVERLSELAGDASARPWAEPLAGALEALGRAREAFAVLATLEETEARIERRAALAESLGLQGEALSLREKVARTPAELERILTGYLLSDLVPFAVRLGARLVAEGSLSVATRRTLAERLAPTEQGAALAAQVWPALLRARVADADGWTLYAEALRHLGREAAATLADGFGAALTRTSGPAPIPALGKVPVRAAEGVGRPEGVTPVSSEAMPRLAAALADTLAGLGAEGVDVVLAPAGGVEAYLAGRTLVLGAGALSAFGQSELPYLVALALSLGEAGAALARPGPVSGFDEAAAAAFTACPASLAAARVLARLDAGVRGGDPRAVDEAAVLQRSAAFRAVALRALQTLETD
jgi:tetratricopeptide (TPR) repeat protein